jgi:hypothetical protein
VTHDLDDDRGRANGDADFEVIAESIPHIVRAAAIDGSVEYFNRRWRRLHPGCLLGPVTAGSGWL